MSKGSTALFAEDARQILDSHLRVGPDKPVSYLPIRTVERVIGITIPAYVSMAENHGHKCSVLYPERCCINSGAIYVYSYEYLDPLLKSNERLLSVHGWPTTPAEFINRIAAEWLEEESPIMPVIRKAFGDAGSGRATDSAR
jgi:hypothetical protein